MEITQFACSWILLYSTFLPMCQIQTLSARRVRAAPQEPASRLGPTNTHNVGLSEGKSPRRCDAGGVIGGVALIALALVAFLFLRRRRHSDKLPPGSTAQETDPPTLVEQVRLLHEQVQRLGVERDNAASGSSSSGGGGSSIGRSLSTMKSEQTRALRSHSGYANGASDSLTHTDSGLRLTAGRTVDEAPPPTYQAD
ncbi:hypothetical protein C8J57DRAFT_1508227 [Mycena rebaudengoi]|nr:hypothetical protein C8J57DRAFT_1508227 [Mycena rebaudengoi]